MATVGTHMKRTLSGVPKRPALRVAGLFAGIGGIEAGLHEAGHTASFFCEFEPTAAAVLQHHFPDAPLIADVRDVRGKEMPDIDLLAGGFPCQDLSQAGRTAGIRGEQSGLVSQMFRIIDELSAEDRCPTWLLIENVENMLRLDQGKGMAFLVEELMGRGFNWAYRLVDTRAFGLPQRRQRVVLLASRTEDPSTVLMADDAGPPKREVDLENRRGHGFYWTEGVRGLGWAPGATPTLKGGSTIGIPSPPAVWMPDDSFVTPGIKDAERLQGFPADWTKPGQAEGSRAKVDAPRWKMVGNAVSVPMAAWVGHRLRWPGQSFGWRRPFHNDRRWPDAAMGTASSGEMVEFQCSQWPLAMKPTAIAKFMKNPKPLSIKAASGFRERTFRAKLDFNSEPKASFIVALDEYITGLGADLSELKRLAADKQAILDSGGSLREARRARRESNSAQA